MDVRHIREHNLCARGGGAFAVKVANVAFVQFLSVYNSANRQRPCLRFERQKGS